MTLQRTLTLALCALLALPAGGLAETKAPDTELEGYVTEVLEGGFLMEDRELGQVMLNVDEQTVTDGVLMEREIEAGLYVLVTYDGRLTRSIPPQAHADKVGCYALQGTVVELPEAGVILMNDEEYGEVLVHAVGSTQHVHPGAFITVYYDGVMAMSLPGQAVAREIVVPKLTGTVSDMDDEGFTLTDGNENAYRVLIDENTLLGELVAAGEDCDGVAQDSAAPVDAIAEATKEVLPTTEGQVTNFETINIARMMQEGDVVTVFYTGEETEETEGEPVRVTALEVLAILDGE